MTDTLATRPVLFCSGYDTEADSALAFDNAIARAGSDIFKVMHREVTGYYLAYRPGRDVTAPRIDRILIPGPKLREQGWDSPIGVELKCTGANLGRAIAQAIDYTWATYRVYGGYVYPEWIFLWPLERFGGPILSVAAQNRVGRACADRYGGLTFGTDNYLISIAADGSVLARPEQNRQGTKRGSR